jgi:hypothetical protein
VNACAGSSVVGYSRCAVFVYVAAFPVAEEMWVLVAAGRARRMRTNVSEHGDSRSVTSQPGGRQYGRKS